MFTEAKDRCIRNYLLKNKLLVTEETIPVEQDIFDDFEFNRKTEKRVSDPERKQVIEDTFPK